MDVRKTVACIFLIAFSSSLHAAARDELRGWKERIAELSKPADDELIISAGGDAIWNRPLSPSDESQAEGLFTVFRSSDIAFLNHEQVLADAGFPAPKPISKADPSIVEQFAGAGINLLSLANNHMMDFGVRGIETTRSTLDARNIVYAGAGKNLEEALKPGLIERKGLKVALLAFMVTPNFPDLATPATPRDPGVAPINGAKIRLTDGSAVYAPWDDDLKRMETAINDAKKVANYVLVSLHIHWGGPATEVDEAGKRLIAHTAIAAGADAVVGHGPQVINGLEIFNGKPIFYSLGTFAWQFDAGRYDFFPDVQKGLKGVLDAKHFQSVTARMTLGRDGKLRRVEILPIQLNTSGNPRLAFGKEGEPMLREFETLSSTLHTVVERHSWFAAVNVSQ